MLKEFKVKNFRGFNEWASINFDGIKDYEFSTNCIKSGLVNKALIYGDNSSGKSNLGFAIMDISTHLFDGINNVLPYKNFLNLNSAESEAFFTYVFKFENDVIEYSYRKDKYRRLTFEKIKENGNLIFQYNYQSKKIINNVVGTTTLKFENNISNISMVKFINNNSNLAINSPIRRIVDFASNMLWFRSVRNFEYISPNIVTEDINDYIIKNNMIGELQKFFENNGIHYNLSKFNYLGKEIIIAFYKNGSAPLSEIASSGTISLWLFFYWMHKKTNISFLFIDDFDAFYHFELSKKILLNIIKNNSFQAVLSTHNTFLCNNEIMRPDCYFMIKNNVITSFANSTNKVIRRGPNLEKMFLSGEFE